VLFNEEMNIRSLEARADDERATDGAVIDITVDVRDKKQLEKIVSSCRRIPGIRDIERVNPS
jgi:GTP pyrophosphokinase